MAIIDSFIYEFLADTDGLVEGEKKADKQTKKLGASIDKVDKQADNLGAGFSNIIATAAGALTAFLSFSALTTGITATADYADALAKTSDRLGENINELGAWQEIVKKSGGDVGGFTSSLGMLNEKIGEIAVKGTSEILPFLQKLGISIKDNNGELKSTLDLLPEIADSFESLSRGESAGIGKRLGLDEGTILLLQQGRVAVEEQIRKQKELFTITREQAAVFEKFNDTVDDTSTAFRGLFVNIGADILPILGYLLERVQGVVGFFKENKDFTVGLFIALGAAISAYALPAIIRFGIASAIAFAPFYIIGGIVAGLAVGFALLYDDITSFLEGGSSAFEKFLNFLGLTEEGVENVREAFKGLGNILSDTFKNLVSLILNPLKYLRELLSLISKVTGINSVYEGAKDLLGLGNQELQALSSTPLNNGSVSTSSNATSTNNNVRVDNITIQTQATDSEQISKTIGNSLSEQLNNVTNNFDDNIQG